MNRIEELIVRQEWESRHEIPILRIATLGVLGIILACMIVVMFYLLSPLMALLMNFLLAIGSGPLFALGRRHARRGLIRRPEPGNIQGSRSY